MDPNLNTAEIGDRLRIKRKSRGLTQAAVARQLEIARTTLVAIEQGQRQVKFEELQRLAQMYDTTINGLMRRETIHVDLIPRFRSLASGNSEIALQAAQELKFLVEAEVELENHLGIVRKQNYPQERPLLPFGDVVRQAENDALELRHHLGLGLAPVSNMVNLLEADLGIRVYVRPLDSSVSGLFAFDERIGSCILLNAKHREERRAQTAAHELGHFIGTRSRPDICSVREYEPNQSREEKYADAFGRCFLTPARAVALKFHEIIAGADKLTRRHVIELSHYFRVSRQAVVRRLEEIGLAPTNTWAWFEEHGGITDRHERDVLQHCDENAVNRSQISGPHQPIPSRLILLASEVFEKQLLSEGQLAQLLDLDRVSLRKMLYERKNEKNDAVDIPQLS